MQTTTPRGADTPSATPRATDTATLTSVTASQPGSDGALTWRQFTDTSIGFSLDVPAAWDTYSNNNGYHSVQFQGSYAGPSTYAQLFIGVTDVPNRITGAEQQYCSSPKTTTVAGYPAVVADQQSQVGTATTGAILRRYFVANGLFYVIQLTSLVSLEQLRTRLGDDCAHVLASFQAGPGKPGNIICPAA